jgi:hypothetical protein
VPKQLTIAVAQHSAQLVFDKSVQNGKSSSSTSNGVYRSCCSGDSSGF